MTCGAARRLLWPDGAPRELTPEVMAAQVHAAECAACQAFLEDMRRSAEWIHQSASRATAPVAVRNRVFAGVARSRGLVAAPHPSRRLAQWGIASAAVLTLALWGTTHVLRPGFDTASGAEAAGALVDDHLRARLQDGIVSSDAQEVAAWLDDRLTFAIHVPTFEDASLTGARTCVMDGRRGAVVEYLADGQPVSYYVLPVGSAAGAPASEPIQHLVRAGYHVVSWRDGELRHAMVGAVPQSRLTQLARLCMEQAQALVALAARFV